MGVCPCLCVQEVIADYMRKIVKATNIDDVKTWAKQALELVAGMEPYIEASSTQVRNERPSRPPTTNIPTRRSDLCALPSVDVCRCQT